jgi:hypothetical protein
VSTKTATIDHRRASKKTQRAIEEIAPSVEKRVEASAEESGGDLVERRASDAVLPYIR